MWEVSQSYIAHASEGGGIKFDIEARFAGKSYLHIN